MTINKPVNIVASLGSSPAIITELLWYLVRKENLHPKEVRIITTTLGRDKFMAEAFQEILSDLLHKLKLRVGFTLHEPFIPVDANNTPYDDINSTDADTAFANLAFKLIQDAASDDEIPLIVSLAGGRKTMSSHMMAALQLLGRKNDRLIHLLVNEPFETIKDYFHPEQEKKELTDWSGNKYLVDNATINALDVPFIPIRSLLNDKGVVYQKREDLFDEAQKTLEKYTLQDKISVLQFAAKTPRLTVTAKNGSKKPYRFEPKETQILLSLIILAKLNNTNEVYFTHINSDEGKAVFAWSYSLIQATKDLEIDDIDRSFDRLWNIDLYNISPTRAKVIETFNSSIAVDFNTNPVQLEQIDKHNRNHTYVDLSSIINAHIKLKLSPSLRKGYKDRLRLHPYYRVNTALQQGISKIWDKIEALITLV